MKFNSHPARRDWQTAVRESWNVNSGAGVGQVSGEMRTSELVARRGDDVEPLIVWEPEWHTVVEHLWTMGELWGDSYVDLLSHYRLEYERKMRRWQRAKHGIVVSWILGDGFRKYERSLRRHLKKCATQLPQGNTDFDTRFARSEIAEIAFCVIRLTWHSLSVLAQTMPWLVLSASLLLQEYSVIDIIKRGEQEHLLAC